MTRCRVFGGEVTMRNTCCIRREQIKHDHNLYFYCLITSRPIQSKTIRSLLIISRKIYFHKVMIKTIVQFRSSLAKITHQIHRNILFYSHRNLHKAPICILIFFICKLRHMPHARILKRTKNNIKNPIINIQLKYSIKQNNYDH